MKIYRLIVFCAAFITLLGLPADRADALPPEAVQSVVSVLPVWPGRAQGGTGGPPGVAPEGSGIVIAQGVIATAWHVIEPARRVDVRLYDGRVLPATPIAHDAASDIALLRIDADLPTFDIVAVPAVATPVCALGNAFGLGLSVTCGVLSAQRITNAGFNPIEDFVQTDAALNPGSSGGALVDRDGRLIGMLSAIFASEGNTNTGVGFAVSSDLLDRVTTALLSKGSVQYPLPGWRLEPASRAQLAVLAAPVVGHVRAGSAADRAGLMAGDLIVQIGLRRVQTPRDAMAALAVLPEGTKDIPLVIQRNGARQESVLVLDALEDAELPNPTALLGACPHSAPVCQMRRVVFPISSFDPVASATRIGPDLVVTNRHVLGARQDAIVHTPDGPRGARLVPSDYRGDLVLLEVDGLPEDWPSADLGHALLDAGPVFAIGADVSRQEVRVFDPGTVIARPADGAALGRLHVTAQMQPGVSGGALVDEAGTLVAIAVGGGDGRFEAIPRAQVQALLEGRNAPNAARVTETLGDAFQACAKALNQTAQDILAQTCALAANHGQLLEAGRVLARAGAYGPAIALHMQAARQVPNSLNARLSLLVSLQLSARFEEMTEHAAFAMQKAPQDPSVLRFAIQSGMWGGKPELAEAAYELLRAADPRQAQAARRFIDNAPPAPPRRE